MSNGQVELPDMAAEAATLLEKELAKTSRDPFKRALQRLLGFRPTAQALQAFADKSPDRWAQAVAIFGALAGYERGINVTLNVQPVEHMTAGQLVEELRRTQGMLAAHAQGANGEVVDAVILPPLPAPVEGSQ